MLSFKQFITERKPMSRAERRKRKIAFKKSLRKRMKKMELNRNRMPKKEQLESRAKRAATRLVIKKKKLLPPDLISKWPTGLNMAQKMKLSKRLDPHKGLIKKVEVKMMRFVRQAAKEELAKRRAKKAGKSTAGAGKSVDTSDE